MVADAHQPEPDCTPICSARRGAVGRVRCEGLSEADAASLRAMGLRDRATVRLCSNGEPCIVQVMGACGCSCRIGLSRPLAQRVMLETE